MCLLKNCQEGNKLLIFLLAENIIPGRKQSFSSYPGFLTSADDFSLLSSEMVGRIAFFVRAII